MHKAVKTFCFSVFSIVLFFALLEGVFRLFSYPGSYDFIERRVVEQNLTKHKKKNEFRIFLFGESTMHGHIYYPHSSIKEWMQIYFEDLLGEQQAKQINIVNFGRLGVDSHFIYKAFKETLVYDPDLVLFYSAHNDFILNDYRPSHWANRPFGKKVRDFFREFAKHSAFVSVVRRIETRFSVKKRKEKDARRYRRKIDPNRWYDGLERKGYDPSVDLLEPESTELQTILTKWQDNIRKIIHLAQKKEVPIVFYAPVSNLKDFMPFESVHKSNLSKDQLIKWQSLMDQAQAARAREDYLVAYGLYSKALDIDPGYALVHYRLGECLYALMRYEEAYDHFRKSSDLDWFPVRAPSQVGAFYQQIKEQSLTNVYVVDTRKLFQKHSENGIIQSQLIMDPIHPTIKGQALMALEVVRWIYQNDLIASKDLWQWDRLRSFDDQYRGLNLQKDFQHHIYLELARFIGSYHDKAIEYVHEALKINPQSLRAQSQLAWIYWKKGDQAKAIELYRRLRKEYQEQTEQFLQEHPDIQNAVHHK